MTEFREERRKKQEESKRNDTSKYQHSKLGGKNNDVKVQEAIAAEKSLVGPGEPVG